MMNKVTTIDGLVAASEAETVPVRGKHGVLPAQVSETFARHAEELRETGRSFGKFQEKEKFGKYLNVLANFPILKTELLLLPQEVVFSIDSEDGILSPAAQLPIFGITKFDPSEDSNPSRMTCRGRSSDEMYVAFYYRLPEISERDSYLRMLKSGLCSVAGHLLDRRGEYRITQSVPKVPKNICQAAIQAKAFGFTELGLVWGPAEYVLKSVPYKADPLIVGKMFDTWWILDQWDVTESEKKLIPTDKD